MVMISTRGRYALRVMIDLAMQKKEGTYAPLRFIAERQGISEKYLESIVKKLVQAGMLAGVRGKGGGYSLTREPEAYTVGDILRLTEGELNAVACLDSQAQACPRQDRCPTLPVWKKLNELVQDYLDSVTLADLVLSAQGKT